MAQPKEYRIAWSLLAPDRILASWDNGTGTEQTEADDLVFFAPIRADDENGITRALIQFYLLGGYAGFGSNGFEAAAKARSFRMGYTIQSLHADGIKKRADGSFDAVVMTSGSVVRSINITPDQIAAYQPSLERAFANARTWAMQAGFTRFDDDLIAALNARTFWG